MHGRAMDDDFKKVKKIVMDAVSKIDLFDRKKIKHTDNLLVQHKGDFINLTDVAYQQLTKYDKLLPEDQVSRKAIIQSAKEALRQLRDSYFLEKLQADAGRINRLERQNSRLEAVTADLCERLVSLGEQFEVLEAQIKDQREINGNKGYKKKHHQLFTFK